MEQYAAFCRCSGTSASKSTLWQHNLPTCALATEFLEPEGLSVSLQAISHLRKHRQIPEFLCIWLDYLAGWKHAEAPSYQKLHDLLDSIQNMQFHAAAGREE